MDQDLNSSLDLSTNFEDFISSIDNFQIPNFDTAFDQSPIYTADILNKNTPQASTTYIAQIDRNNEDAG